MSTPSQPQAKPPLFTAPEPAPSSNSIAVWAVAAAAVLLLVGAVLLLNRHKPAQSATVQLALDPYAANLVISQIVMSESTSLSGGKSTFIDGHVRNAGTSTVTGAMVQVLFGNFDPSQQPQLETTPLTLIRTHDPYIDTEPISVAPLAPGDDREFRLIFEDITPNWNQQTPTIHIVRVNLK